ncbi:MAG TPA: DUF72 domain-containing protein, partial [Methylomirabilota bacterium]|nr:DUF72 domain-containing protein [Methylomirabilota bacterium]
PAMAIHVGCCGFPVARRKYFETFPAVEVQQTFYQIPKLETASKWRQEAPRGFTFAIKAWQLITHEPTSPTYRRLKLELAEDKARRYGSFKPTDEVFKACEETLRFAHELGAAFIVFQCPASFAPAERNKTNMRRFFKGLKRREIPFVWEPRGEWRPEEIRALCEELDLIHCVDPVAQSSLWGRVGYYRLHGPAGYGSRYEAEHLQKLLAACRRVSYCFFNNRFMFQDALAFQRLAGNKQASYCRGALNR